jgi:hypothetical protein
MFLHQLDEFANALDVKNVIGWFRIAHQSGLPRLLYVCTMENAYSQAPDLYLPYLPTGSPLNLWNVRLMPHFLAILSPETWAQHASLWAIRISLVCLFIGLYVQVAGPLRARWVSVVWFVGAMAAAVHSFGSLVSFHHGSQTEAYQSTAEQTRELLGFAFGAGLYVNYAFVVVWLVDATVRLVWPKSYEQRPAWIGRLTLGFLGFIAFNGVVVFKTGWLRWLGISCTIVWLSLWIRTKRKSDSAQEKTLS